MNKNEIVKLLDAAADYAERAKRKAQYAKSAYLFEPPPPTPLPTNPVLLDVPYSAQHESDATWFKQDCGAACIEMLGEHKHGQIEGVGTNQIHTYMTAGKDEGTTKEDLWRAARHFYDIELFWDYAVTIEQLHQWIELGKPSIVLVRYGDFTMRMDRKWTGGHWMVVVGYESFDWCGQMMNRIVVHDPDWYGAWMAQGAYIPVDMNMFTGMWADFGYLALVEK